MIPPEKFPIIIPGKTFWKIKAKDIFFVVTGEERRHHNRYHHNEGDILFIVESGVCAYHSEIAFLIIYLFEGKKQTVAIEYDQFVSLFTRSLVEVIYI
jgi:hypothetical protein